jgi:aspartyl-tRNA(Asn)/glutamyl-tRNA(Gln) amidotransferase subunit A
MSQTVKEVARLLGSGKPSVCDYVESVLEHAKVVEEKVAAFALLDEEGSRKQAVALDRKRSRGEPLGPLFGVPFGVKDVIDVRGLPTRDGSRVTDGRAAQFDASTVARLRSADAIILGKTTTHEFAHGVETPPTKNPWNLSRIPGGSSGGSAAAVAAGECVGALGTDTGGSIRVPAAFCGVSGLRPPIGTVSTSGCIGFSPRMDTCGPIARSAADLDVIYSVICANRPRRTYVTPGFRIGVVPFPALGPIDHDVAEAVARAVEEFEACGCALMDIDVKPFKLWDKPRGAYVLSDFLMVHQSAGWYPYRENLYGDDVRAYLRVAEGITESDRRKAAADLLSLQQAFEVELGKSDCVILPTTSVCAPTSGASEPSLGIDGRQSLVSKLMRLCGPISWCGLSAMSVPCGFSTDGLPIGLQIIARDLEAVFFAADLFQARTSWQLCDPTKTNVRRWS